MQWKEIFEKYKYYVCGGGVIVLIFILIISVFVFSNQLEKGEAKTTFSEKLVYSEKLVSKNNERDEKMERDSEFYVDIKGAVITPGIYKVKSEMRVWDAVTLAGGAKEDADTKQVNFAQKISDQMVIYIPLKGEELPSQYLEAIDDKNKEEGSTSNKIDLNKASEAELQTLTGIGQKKALEIIRYREENAGFKSIEELKNISGVGEKTIEKLKEYLIIS